MYVCIPKLGLQFYLRIAARNPQEPPPRLPTGSLPVSNNHPTLICDKLMMDGARSEYDNDITSFCIHAR
jgi:hypothetical protein